MKKMFLCSLCRGGILGGVLYLDPESLNYKTNKVTVDRKYRNLILPLSEIQSLTWQRILFPIAVVRMEDGEEYKFLLFHKPSFEKHYLECKGQ